MKHPRPLATRLGIAALLAILATTAFAQQDQGGFGPPPGGMQGGPGGPPGGGPRPDRFPPLGRLVSQPDVMTDLGLTSAQMQKIQTIVEASRPQPGQDGPGMGGPGQGGPGGQGRQGGPGMGRERMEDAADAKILATLSNAQIRRLYQIQIQSMGLTAALVPEVQGKLELTDAQKAKLKALVPPRRQGGPGQGGPGGGGPGQGGFGGPPGGDMGGGPGGFGGPPDMQGGQGGPGGRGGPGGGRDQGGGMQDRRKALEAKIAAILTTEQKATLKSLGGKAIKLAEDRGPGGPGGFGGPGMGGPGGPPPDDL